MKLSDIFKDPKQAGHIPKNAIPLMHSAIKKARDVPSHKHLGTGANAYVYQNEDPQEIGNVKRISATTDPTSKYLQTILSTPDLHDNPFLPRVHEVKRPSKKTVEIQMEKLYSSMASPLVNDDEQLMLRALWERYFNRPYPEPQNYKFIVVALVKILNSAVEENHYRFIKDPQLVEALQFIRAFMLKNKAHPDIHYGNVMWRITGNMPQLVITDPLSA